MLGAAREIAGERNGLRTTDAAGPAGKITVAHVVGGLEYGGAETVLYRYLSHMDPAGYRWICISYTQPAEQVRRKFEALGVQVYAITPRSVDFIKSCRETWAILRREHVQIIHAHMTQTSFVPNLIGLAVGVKVRIAHSHNATRSSETGRFALWVYRKLSTWTATDRFACGQEAAKYLFGKRGARRAVIMPNALDYDAFRFDGAVRERMRRSHGLEGHTVLGHVGRFTEQKNHGFLLRAFAEYRKRDENSRLVLIGGGELLEDMKALTEKLGLGESVLFVPPTDDVASWYMAMDVFLLPSLFEGFPLVALEAQIAGLPIVLSDRVPPETALSDRAQFLSLEADLPTWCAAIDRAAEGGRGGGVREELGRRHLDIALEAPRLDHFYRQGIWG